MYQILVFTFMMLNTFFAAAQAQTIAPSQVQTVIDTYQANEARFTHNYRGKKFEGQITLVSVVESPFFNGDFLVKFSAGNKKIGCNIIREKNVIEQIMNWDKGQQIFVTGIIKDVTFGNLELNECKFATPKAN